MPSWARCCASIAWLVTIAGCGSTSSAALTPDAAPADADTPDDAAADGEIDTTDTRVPCVMPDFQGQLVEPCRVGLICHIDDTCIEPGVADEHGVATLADDREGPKGSWGSSLGIGAIVLTDDALFWHDRGTVTLNDYDSGDGSIQRMDLVTGAIGQVASQLGGHTPLIRDDEALYYASRSHLYRMQLDGASNRMLALTVDLETEHRVISWTALDDFVYYARGPGRELLRHDAVSGVESVVWTAPEDSMIRDVFTGTDQIFVVTSTSMLDAPSRLWSIDLDGFSAEVLIGELSRAPTVGILEHGGWIIFDGGAIQRLSVDQPGEPELLVPSNDHIVLESASDGFVYYMVYEDVSQSERLHTIARVALTGGEPEILRETMLEPRSVVAHDGTLYWAENGKLLRMPL